MILPLTLAALSPGLSPGLAPGTLPPPAEDPLAALVTRARLEGGSLEPGAEHAFLVELELPEAWSTAGAGLPAPVLQLDVPPSVELEGRVLESYQELASNEFLAAPYERLLEELPARIPFRLKAEPERDETLGINLTAYVRSPEGEAHFLRRRLELPLTAGAEARPGDPRDSSWGPDAQRLEIGDRVEPFRLPRADGSTFDLANALGGEKVLVVTYRAFW